MSEPHLQLDLALDLDPNGRGLNRDAAAPQPNRSFRSTEAPRTAAPSREDTLGPEASWRGPDAGARRARLPVLDAAVSGRTRRVAGEPGTAGREPAWFTASATGVQWVVVPPGAKVAGDCRGHSVWVRGEVVGRVHATGGLLVVSSGARVTGTVRADGDAVIAGQVLAGQGQCAVMARGRLQLACTAEVQGHVLHGVVAVYEGACVDGELRSACSAQPVAAPGRRAGVRELVRRAR